MQQKHKPYSGLFISIEGGDGCGKSTLAEHLSKALEKMGHSVLRTREPGGPPLSEKIREILLHPDAGCKIGEKAELFLYLAARAQHVEQTILPALRQGQVVVCERFHDSSVAYQGCGRHLGTHYVETLCKLVCDEPDVTLFLDLDPKEGLKRIKDKRKAAADRLEQEELQFHQEVRQAYLHLADANPERITILDASSPFDQVLKGALQALEPCLIMRA